MPSVRISGADSRSRSGSPTTSPEVDRSSQNTAIGIFVTRVRAAPALNDTVHLQNRGPNDHHQRHCRRNPRRERSIKPRRPPTTASQPLSVSALRHSHPPSLQPLSCAQYCHQPRSSRTTRVLEASAGRGTAAGQCLLNNSWMACLHLHQVNKHFPSPPVIHPPDHCHGQSRGPAIAKSHGRSGSGVGSLTERQGIGPAVWPPSSPLQRAFSQRKPSQAN